MSGRCVSCNSKLSDEEMCRKRRDTLEYLDMCTSCLREIAEIVDLPVDLGCCGYEDNPEKESDYYEEL